MKFIATFVIDLTDNLYLLLSASTENVERAK